MLKTMTLLALVMLSTAAPAAAPAEPAKDNDRALTWNIAHYYRNPKLVAKWRNEGQSFKATVIASENAPGEATWTVELEPRRRGHSFEPLKTSVSRVDGVMTDCQNFDTTKDNYNANCKTNTEECVALNWHIHQDDIGGTGKSPADCGTTGGHVDPALACGGSSEYAKTSCKGLNYPDGFSYKERCNGAANLGQAGCEYGDMNGKIGKIANKAFDEPQTFPTDTHIFPLSNYKKNSVVFHCCTKVKASCNCEDDLCSNCEDDGGLSCKPRVACGDFDYSN